MQEFRKVLLDINVFDALKVEALVRHKNLKDTIAEMILENLSPEAHEILKCINTKNTLMKLVKPLENDATIDENTKKALGFILEELEKGNEPTVNLIADKMGLTTTGLGKILSLIGIKAKNTHRDMKTVRIYTKPMESKIREILNK
jgi:hypothetical protein